MQDPSRPFMMSPMDAAGEERLRQVRAHIHKAFGPDGRGRRTKRTLEMPAEPPTPAKTPRTKLRQRIQQASQLSADQIFSQHFGSRDELWTSDFDLSRPAGHPIPRGSRRVLGSTVYPSAKVATTRSEVAAVRKVAVAGAPGSYFSYRSSVSAPAVSSSLFPKAALSSAPGSQLTRPSGIRTPRKAVVKRGRSGESSAEKALVLRKPRLAGASLRDVTYKSAATNVQVGAQTTASETRKSLATSATAGDGSKPQATLATRLFAGASPSKFQFASSATRLFTQRQAPLR
uniref:Uncharacterized protein n=1 Tax=Hyaloperonospora arabidopsidis (strain Emoy2) TaxID=559515 RepID=M4BKV3_HYAAE